MTDFETILEGERFKGHLKTVSVGSIRILTVNIPVGKSYKLSMYNIVQAKSHHIIIIIISVIFIIMQTSGWEQEWRSLRAPRKTVRLRLQLDTTADPDKDFL